MTYITPPAPRFKVTQELDALQITIPARTYGIQSFASILLFIPLLGGFVCGCSFLFNAIASLLAGESIGLFVGLFIVLWLGIWSANALTIGFSNLWQFFGKEEINVRQDGITIRRKIFRFMRAKVYDAQHIRNLRVSPKFRPARPRHYGGYHRLWPFVGGTIAFDYGAKTFYYGVDAEEAEAGQILAIIHERFPQYAAKPPSGYPLPS